MHPRCQVVAHHATRDSSPPGSILLRAWVRDILRTHEFQHNPSLGSAAACLRVCGKVNQGSRIAGKENSNATRKHEDTPRPTPAEAPGATPYGSTELSAGARSARHDCTPSPQGRKDPVGCQGCSNGEQRAAPCDPSLGHKCAWVLHNSAANAFTTVACPTSLSSRTARRSCPTACCRP